MPIKCQALPYVPIPYLQRISGARIGQYIITRQSSSPKDGSFNVQSSSNVNKNDDSDNDNVIQISDDDDSDDGRVPKCKICKKYYIYFCNFWDLEV